MADITLPKRDGTPGTESLKEIDSLVIVGANGSGKSRLGYWLEHQQGRQTHRVSAQRSLVFENDVHPAPFDKAQRRYYFGTDSAVKDRTHRWGGNKNRALSHLLSDYDALLSLLFAYNNRRNKEHVEETRAKKAYVEPLPSKLETLLSIWKSVLPHRELVASDDKILAKTPAGTSYAALDMSDGERVAFYLIGEVLTAPDNAIVIIDEPEIHLHRAIQARLWDEIEGSRPDCVLVYITHDLEFAASRATATKIVVSSFDGKYWNWGTYPASTALPESLFLEVLGSRRRVLFVEGEVGSMDIALLSLVLPEFLIIPRGGCEKVVESTKGLRELPTLHHMKPFGLVDRDYRTDEELDALKSHGVFSADVAEIENLLCIDGVTGYIAAHLKLDVEATVQKVHDFVLRQLRDELDQQIVNRTQKEIAFRLAGFGAKAKSKADLQAMVGTFTTAIDVETVYSDNHALFQSTLNNSDFMQAIKLYNRKSLASRISVIFGLKDGGFSELVLRLLKEPGSEVMASKMKDCLPKFV